MSNLSFSGHESFPLRFAWLKKGYNALLDDPHTFSQEEAMVKLGVGKNMVRSILHWGRCCGAWENAAEGKHAGFKPSIFGNKLLANDGWDPYLEDLGTLWWLHWTIVTHPTKASAWAWLFGQRSGASAFTRELLAAELDDWQQREAKRKTSPSTLKRDVEVLVRSYMANHHHRFVEDALDAPLAQLGLLQATPEDKHRLTLVAGEHPTLPLGIVEAAIADFCRRTEREGQVSLRDLLFEPGAPGRVFRLTEAGLVSRLEALASSGWLFDDTAGIAQLRWRGELPTPLDVLERHYEGTHGSVA